MLINKICPLVKIQLRLQIALLGILNFLYRSSIGVKSSPPLLKRSLALTSIHHNNYVLINYFFRGRCKFFNNLLCRVDFFDACSGDFFLLTICSTYYCNRYKRIKNKHQPLRQKKCVIKFKSHEGVQNMLSFMKKVKNNFYVVIERYLKSASHQREACIAAQSIWGEAAQGIIRA